MSDAIAICPRDAICAAGLVKLRDLYQENCCPDRLIVGLEFSHYYTESKLSSHEKFGSMVGMTRYQVERILNFTSLPSWELLERARKKVRRLFGEPKRQWIASRKRRKTIEFLLPLLRQHNQATNQLPNYASHQVEKLSCKLPIPDHSTFACVKSYRQWVHDQVRHFRSATVNDVNAAGHFLAVREYLDGFDERLFEDVKFLVENERDCEATASAEVLWPALIGIEVTLDVFKSHAGCLPAIRRELPKRLNVTVSPSHNAPDELVIGEFLKPWGLMISDFEDDSATTGYLVMHSPDLRIHANNVLHHPTFTQ